VPTGMGKPGSVKVPSGLPVLSAWPSKIEIFFEVEFTRTTSGGWVVENFLLSLRKTPVPMATWPVSLARSVIGDGVT